MARIRSVKPETWSDRRLAHDLTRDQRLFYIGLWNEADDEGRLVADGRKLLGAIFPYERDLDETFVEGTLIRLVATGRAVLYELSGEHICQLVKFSKHQRVNRPTPSKLPPPPRKMASRFGWLSMRAHGELTEGSPWEVEVEVEVEQGTGSREVEWGRAHEVPDPEPHDQPVGRSGAAQERTPDPAPVDLGGFLDGHPRVAELLPALRHEGGIKATAAAIATRFLLPDGDAMLDPVVKGLPLADRERLVMAGLIDFATQGKPWNRPYFVGFLKRLRDQEARGGPVLPSPPKAQPTLVPVDRNGKPVAVNGAPPEASEEIAVGKLVAELGRTIGTRPPPEDPGKAARVAAEIERQKRAAALKKAAG